MVKFSLLLPIIYTDLTFKCFPLEQTSVSPTVSLLKSLTVTIFILRVDIFPFFNSGGTTSGCSLSHIDMNDTFELKSNGSDDLFSLLKKYCNYNLDRKILSFLVTSCWKSYQVIVDGMVSSNWIPLTLSSTSIFIWNSSASYCKYILKWTKIHHHHLHHHQLNCLWEDQGCLQCFLQSMGGWGGGRFLVRKQV